MSKKIIKIMGILLCLLISAQITPVIIGAKANSTMNTITITNPNVNTNSNFNPDSLLKLFRHHIERAMIIGHISDIHRIGRIVVAHAEKIHYFVRDGHGMHMGILLNKEIIFRQNPRLHMMCMHREGVFIFGHVREIMVL